MVSKNSRKAGPACWLLYISSSELWPDRQYNTPTLYLLDNPCSSNLASASSAAGVPSLKQPNCTSGATNSRSSLVGGRPCGLMPRASSGTEPRSVSNSDVRTITRYWLTSLRTLIATGPSCSSMPNQFWCSRPVIRFRSLYMLVHEILWVNNRLRKIFHIYIYILYIYFLLYILYIFRKKRAGSQECIIGIDFVL